MVKIPATDRVEERAKLLYCVAHGVEGPMDEAWDAVTYAEKGRFRVLARAVHGVVHIDHSHTGPYPTAPQADTIRGLRDKYLREDGRERSWIGAETKPYGEMVVLFEHANEKPPGSRQINWRVMGFLVYPDGGFEELHQSSVGSP